MSRPIHPVVLRYGPPRPAPLAALVAAAALALSATGRDAAAQTDYYNTDAGRPITIEDAYPVERRAVELQLAPLRLERARGGAYHWGVEPELAIGILPRTHVEVGLPLAFVEGGGRRTAGLAGIELSALHNFNVETTIPALALVADVLIPAGALASDRAYPSLKGIATRTFPWARFHANAQYTFGAAPGAPAEGGVGGGATGDVGPGAVELSRWQAGMAVDRPFPLQSLLVTGELYARRPLRGGRDVEWNTGGGVRYQLSPRVAGDAGGGYRLTGDDRGWYATVGAAVVVGLPWRTR